MRKIFYLGILSLALAGCSSENVVDEPLEVAPPAEDPKDAIEWTYTTHIGFSADETPTVEGINNFSYELMKEMALASENGEFSLSPISVAIYLGMLANATAGETNAQILEALGADNIINLNSVCEKYMHHLPYDENGSSISINNRFWVNNTYNVPSEFSDLMASSYNAGVETVDFKKETTVPAINQWVSDNTNGLIQALLEGDWKDYVSLTMANANTVYFKGLWMRKFDKNNTKTEKFQTAEGLKDVNMMHRDLRVCYSSSEKAEMLILDFEGPVNRMEFYLPAKGVSVQQLIAELTPAKQNEMCNSIELCDVALSLPQFNMNGDYNLGGALSALGITSLQNADFTPMGLGIQPASVVHKTSVKIDEEGAEMAAMTGGWIGAGGDEDREFRKVKIEFNRPFVYIVRNSNTSAILMAGTVTNP